MIFGFDSILDTNMMNSAKVIVILGQYATFNNRVVDYVREETKGSLKKANVEDVQTMLDEFGIRYDSEIGISNDVDIDEFMKVVVSPPLEGKWFCNVYDSMMTKKQKEKVFEYIKHPSENGKLVVIANEWKQYKDYKKSKILKTSKESHIMQLDFARRDVLRKIVSEKFRGYGKVVEDRAIGLFLMKMSNAYDDYDVVIKGICEDAKQYTKIKYDLVKESMQGIENYMLDDYINCLIKETKSKKVTSRKAYKVLNSLNGSMSYKEIAKKVKYKVEDLIEFRIAINKGVIPVLVKYGEDDVKKRISDESRIKRISGIAFKKGAYIASQNSLRDWYYIKLMLNTVNDMSTEMECFKVLMSVTNRAATSVERLLNDIKIKNVLEEGLYDVNRAFYTCGYNYIENKGE